MSSAPFYEDVRYLMGKRTLPALSSLEALPLMPMQPDRNSRPVADIYWAALDQVLSRFWLVTEEVQM